MRSNLLTIISKLCSLTHFSLANDQMQATLPSVPRLGLFTAGLHMLTSLTQYIGGALEELRHVRWPTRQQAIRFSGVVIIFTLLCALLFGLIDFSLSELIQALLSLV